MTIDLAQVIRSKTIRAGLVILAGWINSRLPAGWDIAIRIGQEIYTLQDLIPLALPVIFWGRATAKGPLVGGKDIGNGQA